jgi:hypothetical protein
MTRRQARRIWRRLRRFMAGLPLLDWRCAL